MGACSSAEETRRESKHTTHSNNTEPRPSSHREDRTVQYDDATIEAPLHFSKVATLVDRKWDLGKLRLSTIAPCPERGELLKELPLLHPLNETDRDLLGGMMVERRFRPGAVVFRQGEAPDGFYIIIRGGARVSGCPSRRSLVTTTTATPEEGACSVTTPSHEDIRLDESQVVVYAHLRKGDYFGETALLNNSLRSATVTSDPWLESLAAERVAEKESEEGWNELVEGFVENEQIPGVPEISSEVEAQIDREAEMDRLDAEEMASEKEAAIMRLVKYGRGGKPMTREQAEMEVAQANAPHNGSNDLVTLYLCKDLFDSFFRAKLQQTQVAKMSKKSVISQRFADDIRMRMREQADFGGAKVHFAKRRAGVTSGSDQDSNHDGGAAPEIERFNFPLHADAATLRSNGPARNKIKKLLLKAFQKNPYLSKLDTAQQVALVEQMHRVTVPPGSTHIIEQGETGALLYVLVQTPEPLRVLKDGVCVGRIPPGTVFGELALLLNERRAATVCAPAVNPHSTELWAVDRFTFQRISRRVAEATVHRVAEFLKSVPLLQPLTENERFKVAECVEERHFEPGAAILREGDVGNCLYLLVAGSCVAYCKGEGEKSKASKKSKGKVGEKEKEGEKEQNTSEDSTVYGQKMARYSKPGEYFGEAALHIADAKRRATVIAEDYCVLLKVTRAAFDLLLESPLQQTFIDGMRRYGMYIDGETLSRRVVFGTDDEDEDREEGDREGLHSDAETDSEEEEDDEEGEADDEEEKLGKDKSKGKNKPKDKSKDKGKSKETTKTKSKSKSKGKSSVASGAVDLLKEIERRLGSLASEDEEVLELDTTKMGKGKNKTKDVANSSSLPGWKDLRAKGILGKGSFGVVRLVEDLRNGKQYALKTLDKDRLVKPSQQKQVVNEVRLMGALRHPFILGLHGTYRSTRHLHMLLPLAAEGDLFGLLRRKQFFPEEQARFYGGIIAMALGYMHSKDVVYRDLKPENVLIWADGYVKLADLGFAKKMAGASRTWTVCGTPEYLSPEILAGRGHHKTADWWTLGVFIYEMLASHPPFTDRTQVGIFKAILAGNLRFPSHFSPQARTLITELLNPSSSQRLGAGPHGTARVMAQDWFGLDRIDKLEKATPARATEASLTLPQQGAGSSSTSSASTRPIRLSREQIEEDARRSVDRHPATAFFEALRLRKIKAPEWKDERRVTALQRAQQTRGPGCGIPTSEAEIADIAAIASGKADTEWDAEFGPKVDGTLMV